MDIEIRNFISPKDFRSKFLDRAPLLVKGYAKRWDATRNWRLSLFKERFGETLIQTKRFLGNGQIKLESEHLDSYVEKLIAYESSRLSVNATRERPPYWHDVPIFQIFKELEKDINFDPELLPKYYRRNWSQYVQFFMSSSDSVTKLHFDTLRTHNIFFQIVGTKVWTILPPQDHDKCGRTRWRWFQVDPENPDYERYPEYQQAKPQQVIVEAGDMLYIPPGTLHHVRSLDFCISFNIDFHTQKSVINSFRFANKGMPREVLFYNFLSFLGVTLKLPERVLFRYYKTYLNYVS